MHMHSKHRIYWIVRIINAYRSKVSGIEHLCPSSFALKGDLFLYLLPIDPYLFKGEIGATCCELRLPILPTTFHISGVWWLITRRSVGEVAGAVQGIETMPHRPESELTSMHSGAGHDMLHPVEALMHPQKNYALPIRTYPSQAWEGYSPAIEGAYPPSSYPQQTISHQFDTMRGSLECDQFDERLKRARSDDMDDLSRQPSRPDKPDQNSPASINEAVSVTSESSIGSHFVSGQEPFKKRKKHLDVLRRNRCWLPTQRAEPTSGLLPSPVSSVGSSNIENQCDTTTPTPPTMHASRSESYDFKEAKAITNTGAIGETPGIAPATFQVEASQHPAVPNFPDYLHMVLSEPDATGSVLQWLPHGHAWRVVRWDALRRNVLPKYFPQLCQEEEDGSSGGSIDAFLWNVRAWGFEEIKDGADVGAYAHKVSGVGSLEEHGRPSLLTPFVSCFLQHFRRGLPKLSKQMRFASVPPGDEEGKSHPQTAQTEPPESPGSAAKLLRVPSLATSRSDGSGENRRPDTPEKYQQWHYPVKDEYSRPNHQYHDMYHVGAYGWHYPITVPHHSDDPSMVGRHYQPHSVFRHGVSCPPPYDSRYPFRPHPNIKEVNNLSSGAPSSIRSGRGGGRLGIHSSQYEMSSKRASYPVSQRGKGSRGMTRLCEIPTRALQSNNESPVTHSNTSAAIDNRKGTSPLPQEDETISRKSKKSILLERSLASDATSK
jgi:hypothetical protein